MCAADVSCGAVLAMTGSPLVEPASDWSGVLGIMKSWAVSWSVVVLQCSHSSMMLQVKVVAWPRAGECNPVT